MDRYDEMAQDVFTGLSGDWNTVYIIPKFAQALREAAAEAYEDAAGVCLSELEHEQSKENGGGHLSSLSCGYSEACNYLREQINSLAAALRGKEKSDA